PRRKASRATLSACRGWTWRSRCRRASVTKIRRPSACRGPSMSGKRIRASTAGDEVATGSVCERRGVGEELLLLVVGATGKGSFVLQASALLHAVPHQRV